MNLSSVVFDVPEGGYPSPEEHAQSLVQRRVLRATSQLLAERGFGVSMEDIAEAAGVGRRTLFRHFNSREDLLAAAISAALDWYDVQLDSATAADQPLDEWLEALVTRVHRIHTRAGRGLWQLAATDDADLPAQLAAVNRRRRRRRRATTKAIALAGWRRAGGTGPCPEIVTDACALTISSFTTYSMINDYGRPTGAVVRCTASLLGQLLRAEVERAANDGTNTTRSGSARSKRDPAQLKRADGLGTRVRNG